MTALSLNINVAYEDKYKEINVDENVSDNSSMDVSESERNIVNETLSQKNSADVPKNTITDLKYGEHMWRGSPNMNPLRVIFI